MKRRAFVRTYANRIALTFLLLCLIVYTVYHAIWSGEGRLLTTPARQITDTELLGGEAWLFRDETLLHTEQAGLVNSIAVSGEKVGKNSALAEVWIGTPEGELAERQEQLDQLNHTLTVLQNSLPPAGSTVASANGYREEGMDTLWELRMALREGDFARIDALGDSALAALNRYAALTGGEDAIREALQTAEQQRDALLLGSKLTLSNTDSSAYYYDRSAVDGLESVFTVAALRELSAERLDELTQESPQLPEGGSVAGKLCYGYSWYLAVRFPDRAGELFRPEYEYSICFPQNRELELTLTCEKILQGADGQTVAIFRSDTTPQDFRFLRTQSVEITVGSTHGFYIPRDAHVLQNGMDGVYVFEDSTVRFRRIFVLYKGDGYLIAALQDPTPESEIAYLNLNDLIVTSGKELYDGKVYQ